MYNISYMLYHIFYVYTYTYIHRYASSKMRWDVYLFLQLFIYINMYINCKESHIYRYIYISGESFIFVRSLLSREKSTLSLSLSRVTSQIFFFSILAREWEIVDQTCGFAFPMTVLYIYKQGRYFYIYIYDNHLLIYN